MEEEINNSRQITCGNCDSLQQQLIKICQEKDETIIELLCMGCGAISIVTLTGVMRETKLIKSTKPTPNYTE